MFGFWKKPQSLASRLTFWFVLLVLLTMMAAWLPEIWLINDRFQRETWARLEQGRRAGRALYAATQTEVMNAAILASQLPTLQEQLANRAVTDLQVYLETLEPGLSLDMMTVCDPEGQIVAAIDAANLRNACRVADTYEYVVENGVNGPEVWLMTQHPIMHDGSLLGFVGVGIKLDNAFAAMMRNQTELEHTILIDGQPVATSLEAGVDYWDTISERQAYDAGRVEGDAQSRFMLAGQPYYATRLTLGSPGLQDEVALTASGIVRTQNTLLVTQLASIVLVTVVGSILGLLVARRMASPLALLAEEASAFSRGDMASSIEVETDVTEVLQVARALEQARVELRHTLDTLRREKAWIENLLQAIVEGIVTLDDDGRVTFFSRGAERLLGMVREDVLGQPCNEVFRTGEEAEPFSELVPLPGNQRRISVIDARGRKLTISVTRAELAPPEAGSARAAIVFRDVSEEEAYRRLVNHFMANVTHEFRTPLTALGASVELLMDQADELSPEELQQMLDWLHLGILNLHTLVDNLLESASLETGRFQVSPAPADLGEIIADAARSMQPLFSKYDQRLSISLPSNIPVVSADARRVVQVLVNLLSNANKYSPEDTDINLEATRSAGAVRISVSDQGPGVPEAFGDDLFHRFTHDSSQSDKGKYGIGLGLWVVKGIVEAHGGSVGVEDVEGGGARFWFTLPAVEDA